jgi:hypothetical protein
MATKLQTVEKVLDELPDDTLHRAMARAFAEIEAATKSQDNPFFKSKYADLGAIIGTVKPALVNHGLFFTQHCHPSDDGVIVETILHHRAGESLSMGQLYVPANKRDPQGFGSAQTYARRYALQTAFGVPVEDDDGNSAVRATANPTTGETPPAKRVKLDGPYTCKTQLQAAAKQFANTLSKMGDMGELIAWENTTDYAEFVAQCQKDMPTLWFGSDDMPAEFIPLAIRVADKRRELEELESLRS